MLIPLASVGPLYDVTQDDIVPAATDCTRQIGVLLDNGMANIVAACEHESQVDRALEATMTMYPPLVCKAEGLPGGVTIHVIQN